MVALKFNVLLPLVRVKVLGDSSLRRLYTFHNTDHLSARDFLRLSFRKLPLLWPP